MADKSGKTTGRVKAKARAVATEKSAPKSRSKAAAKGGPADDAVLVRMYGQGLGDCFLVRLPRPGRGARPFFLMIDCGVILGTPDPVTKIRAVVQDITDFTGGRIDLLVVTHEHWDHVSGFIQARDLFDALTIDAVWLAWTEDPADPIARGLLAERAAKLDKARAAIAALADHLGAADADVRAAVEALSFFGVGPDTLPADALAAAGAAAGAGQGTTADAMAWLKARKPTFLRPGGEPRPLPGLDGVRAFVLGPPTDLKKLRKDSPTKTGAEVYDLAAADQSLFHALAHDDEDALPDPYRPFNDRHVLTPEQAADLPSLRETYFAPTEAWRRIDGDWLAAIAEFALQLDSDTNNTSLALAIELADGRVLLFPGDAQVGNWESWHDQTWTVDKQPISARDLLNRTVVYKVGHHGSHNATLRAKGLEMMSRDDLVALLPVDEYIARAKKGWAKMPFGPLMDALDRLAPGRVLRPDRSDPPADPAFAANVRFGPKTLKVETEAGPDVLRPLYVEYRLPPAPR